MFGISIIGFLLSPILIIVGLIQPLLFSRLGINTRKKVVSTFISLFLISFVLAGVTAPPVPESSAEKGSNDEITESTPERAEEPEVTSIPEPRPVATASPSPTINPSPIPTLRPTLAPTSRPTTVPTKAPTPTTVPTKAPTPIPTPVVKKSTPTPPPASVKQFTNAGTGAGGYSGSLSGDKDCKDFSRQAQAQAYFIAKGGSPSNNVDDLDRDHDGIACETLPK